MFVGYFHFQLVAINLPTKTRKLDLNYLLEDSRELPREPRFKEPRYWREKKNLSEMFSMPNISAFLFSLEIFTYLKIHKRLRS